MSGGWAVHMTWTVRRGSGRLHDYPEESAISPAGREDRGRCGGRPQVLPVPVKQGGTRLNLKWSNAAVPTYRQILVDHGGRTHCGPSSTPNSHRVSTRVGWVSMAVIPPKVTHCPRPGS